MFRFENHSKNSNYNNLWTTIIFGENPKFTSYWFSSDKKTLQFIHSMNWRTEVNLSWIFRSVNEKRFMTHKGYRATFLFKPLLILDDALLYMAPPFTKETGHLFAIKSIWFWWHIMFSFLLMSILALLGLNFIIQDHIWTFRSTMLILSYSFTHIVRRSVTDLFFLCVL